MTHHSMSPFTKLFLILSILLVSPILTSNYDAVSKFFLYSKTNSTKIDKCRIQKNPQSQRLQRFKFSNSQILKFSNKPCYGGRDLQKWGQRTFGKSKLRRRMDPQSRNGKTFRKWRKTTAIVGKICQRALFGSF